mmetsp:Transcript_42551/g.113680  ORF Transcript_42551/g.113680 Transcript_42551/m.113680 type:complete len:230 (+) Transcript_42551:1825-2514(+)
MVAGDRLPSKADGAWDSSALRFRFNEPRLLPAGTFSSEGLSPPSPWSSPPPASCPLPPSPSPPLGVRAGNLPGMEVGCDKNGPDDNLAGASETPPGSAPESAPELRAGGGQVPFFLDSLSLLEPAAPESASVAAPAPAPASAVPTVPAPAAVSAAVSFESVPFVARFEDGGSKSNPDARENDPLLNDPVLNEPCVSLSVSESPSCPPPPACALCCAIIARSASAWLGLL